MPSTKFTALLLASVFIVLLPSRMASDETLLSGIIGCDTSHKPAFTRIQNYWRSENA